ncbi:MAG TPA: GNAT family N-acetyltransferase [Xanthobacteraceae bacterium]|jgi:ribosomal protein S18 acetylase RimI-like enzyme|nr:GNAT family N-acetyltransferase [Xanthobacteraceae bacterium]
MEVRAATARDDDAIWRIIGPTIRAGETYALPRDISRADALAYWKSPGHEVFVAEENGTVLGTYYLRANQRGGGAHVANCGYMTAAEASGRGVARAMCAHSLARAKVRGFRAMQFNFVVGSNTRAIALWQSFGFAIVGRLPEAFAHPRLGDIEAVVMYRKL